MLEPEARVSALINSDTGDWDRSLVYQVFNEEEAATICNILISRAGAVDRLCWWPSKDGRFFCEVCLLYEEGKT